MDSEVKIIQIVPCPNNATWQGALFGLGSDGVIYEAEYKSGKWAWKEIVPLNFENVN